MDDLESLTGDESQHWRSLRGASLQTLGQKSQALTTDFSHCLPEIAARRARILIGAYRRTDIDDPEVYFSSVVAVLSRFSEGVVVAVTDPASGLPSMNKWPPALAEIRAECERLDGCRRRAREREERVETQLREREEWERNYSQRPITKEQWDAVSRALGAANPHAEGRILDARNASTPDEERAAIEFHSERLNALRDRYAADPIKLLFPELRKQFGETP